MRIGSAGKRNQQRTWVSFSAFDWRETPAGHVAGIQTGHLVVTRHAQTIGVASALGCLIGIIAHAAAAPPTPIELEQGRAIYQRHCADCHGPEGRGDGPQATSLSPRPGNLISAQTSAKSDQELMKIIAKGRQRTAMTGWEDRLSAEEQAAVLGYIRSLVKFTRSATPAPPQP